MWYIQTMEYYSGIKRMQSSVHDNMWRKLKCILLSERSQSEKATYHMTPTTWYYGKGKIRKTAKKISDCQGLGGWKRMNRSQKIWEQGKYSVWYQYYNNGYVSLHVYPNPLNIQHQEWALVDTMDFGWLWCVCVGSSVETNVPLW